MVTRTLVPGLMLFLLLGAQTALPGLSSATDCCPCHIPCAPNCRCRANNTHCPICHEGRSDAFQRHAVKITPSSEFSATQDVALAALLTLPVVTSAVELVARGGGGNRTIGNFTSRLLSSAEFKLKAWCPEPLDKTI